MDKRTREYREHLVHQQRIYMLRQGGGSATEAGYVHTYGSISDPDHSGDGGEAIYAADLAYLRKLEDAAGIHRRG